MNKVAIDNSDLDQRIYMCPVTVNYFTIIQYMNKAYIQCAREDSFF